MVAFVLVQAEVHDWDRFRKYLEASPEILARYGGRYIARGGETAVLEGAESGSRVVLIEFPSMDKVREWYRSEEYQRIKRLREGAATGSLIAVEGCDGPA